MAVFSVFVLGEDSLDISDGIVLSGGDQGAASQFVVNSTTITILDDTVQEFFVEDDQENTFDDSDDSQTAFGDQTLFGLDVPDGTRVEAEYTLTLSDGTNTIIAYGFNVNTASSDPAFGSVEGLVFVGGVGDIPAPGTTFTVIGIGEGPGNQTLFSDLASPICFTAGCRIRTPDGDRLIEELSAGDLVLTRDHGPQPLRWIGRRRFPGRLLSSDPRFTPVRIAPDALGSGQPARALCLSPQHRVLLRDWRAELLFGSQEVLVSVRHLIDDHAIAPVTDSDDVTYYHLLFDRHELVWADDLLTESFHPGDVALSSLDQASRDEVLAFFPELDAPQVPLHRTARATLKPFEVAALARLRR